MAKDWKDVTKAALEQHWKVEQTKKGHWRFTPPDPKADQVIASGTPGDQRALDKHISLMRRSGFIWPWPPKQGKSKKQ